MDVKDVSVCLVNHNASQMTLNCLSSLYQLTRGAKAEVIVVDNNSSDGSVEAIQKAYPEVIIIQNKHNTGFAAANNRAIKQARGKFILLLNNDTVLKNDILKIMCNFANDHPRAGIVTCKIFEPDGKIQKNCRSFPLTPFDTMFGRASLLSKLFPNNPITKRTTLSDWDYNSPRQVDWVSGACMLVKREVFEQIGLLDENFFMYWEDTDFCKRAHDAGWEIWFTPEAEIVHYSGQGGTKLKNLRHNLKMMFHMHYSAYKYFRKHYYQNFFHPVALLALAGMIILVSCKSFIETVKYIRMVFTPRS